MFIAYFRSRTARVSSFDLLFYRVCFRLQKETKKRWKENKFYVFPVKAIRIFRLEPYMKIVRENVSNELCGDVNFHFLSPLRLIIENSAPWKKNTIIVPSSMNSRNVITVGPALYPFRFISELNNYRTRYHNDDCTLSQGGGNYLHAINDWSCVLFTECDGVCPNCERGGGNRRRNDVWRSIARASIR